MVVKPKSKLIRVVFNRLRHCPREISNDTDSEKQLRKSTRTADNVSTSDDLVVEDCESCVSVEEPATITGVQAKQSTDSEDVATGGEGNR